MSAFVSNFIANLSPVPSSVLLLLGGFSLVKFLVSISNLAYNLYLRQPIPLSKFGAGSSSWALITGSSDGIGKEFALHLAKAKFNVILLARTESKLVALSKQIRDTYKVDTKVIVFDFNTDNPTEYTRLAMQLHGLDIAVLVNNVGTNHEFPVSFIDESIDTVSRIVQVNIQSVLKITHMVTPRMVENRCGLILNVSSFAGIYPQPLLSVYSGSKSFLTSWSQALGKELKDMNITVQCLDTYFVVSNMSKISKPSLLIPDAKTFVGACFAKLGNQCGSDNPYSSSPYAIHAWIVWLLRHLMTPYLMVEYGFYIQTDIRRRALRKLQRLNSNVKNEVKKEE